MRQSLYKTIKHPLWWVLALLLIALRIPSLHRPLSKHHEQTSAVLLINSISWKQGGGGTFFHFVPLLNFQGAANKLLEQGPHTDSSGNHVYLSYGVGWYLLPYAVFETLGIAHTPFHLRVFSIIFGLITYLLLAAWLARWRGTTKEAITGAGLFCLLPAPLWYTGIDYVNTGLMLPFIILLLWQWQEWASHPQNMRWRHLLLIAVAGFAAIQVDWYGVFVLAGMGTYALVQWRRHPHHKWLLLTGTITVFISVFSIFWQFAGYLGWSQVMDYWLRRFGDRSMQTPTGGTNRLFLLPVVHMATGFAPLLIPVWVWWKNRSQQLWSNSKWLWWLLASTLCYNLLFLNWSAEHEFAWLALGLVIFVMLWSSIDWPYQKKATRIMMLAMGMWSIIQYLVINLPGAKSYKGYPYAAQMKLGENIRQRVKPEQVILTNLPYDKITEYYAARTFNQAAKLDKARHLTDSLEVDSAIWLDIRNNEIVSSKIIRPR